MLKKRVKKNSNLSEYPSIEQFIVKNKKVNFIESKITAQIERVNLAPPTEDNNSVLVKEANERMNDALQRVKVTENNLKIAKNLLRKSTEVNLEKDFQIRELRALVEKDSTKGTDRKLPYEDFAVYFDSAEMKNIRSIKPGQRNDSTFILKIMTVLYKKNEAVLNNRSATGKKYKKETKAEISFEKKTYNERNVK